MSASMSQGRADIRVARRTRSRITPGRIILYAVAILIALILMIPFIWSFGAAVKANDEIFGADAPILPTTLHWDNFVTGWNSIIGGDATANFTRFTINTLIITLLNVVGTVVSCVIVAYGFSRFRFPGRDALFLVLLSTMMIPYAITLIPQYIIFSAINWVDTFAPLTVPAFFGAPYFIFLLRQFFMGIPFDLDEAARIDGAGSFRILWQVLIPEIKPAVIAMTVLTFIGTYKDVFAPLVYLQSPNNYTIEIGLAQFHNAISGNPQWNLLTAVSLVTMIPMIIIFLMASKYIVRGVTLSGMGGT